MTKVLILGASGRIARHVVDALVDDDAFDASLLLRDASRLSKSDTGNMAVIEGDVLDSAILDGAMAGQDIVYANLTGEDIDDQAKAVIAAMQKAGVKRLIFIASLGIYDEVPGAFGEWNNAIIGEDLKPFRRAADAIEASDLDYTIVRPAWLTDADEVDFELTQRDEPFKGTEISRKSVAAYVLEILRDPATASRGNIGIDKPGTDGDKPAFM